MDLEGGILNVSTLCQLICSALNSVHRKGLALSFNIISDGRKIDALVASVHQSYTADHVAGLSFLQLKSVLGEQRYVRIHMNLELKCACKQCMYIIWDFHALNRIYSTICASPPLSFPSICLTHAVKKGSSEHMPYCLKRS